MKIDFNGNLFEENQPIFSAGNRGYNYGDGLFETMRVIQGEIVFWQDHYDRLTAGMNLLQMQIPDYWSKCYLQSQIINLIEENKLSSQPVRVKLNVHRDAAGLYSPNHHHIKYLIRTLPLSEAIYTQKNEPYSVEVFKTHRIASGVLSNLKNTSKLINVLGSIYAEKNGFDNCLLLNEQGSVVEALNGNVFLIKDNYIKTPPLSDGSLAGITRKKIKELVEQTTFQIEQTSVSVADLLIADEIWITNSIVGIQPVTQYNQRSYKNIIAHHFIDLLNKEVQKEVTS